MAANTGEDKMIVRGAIGMTRRGNILHVFISQRWNLLLFLCIFNGDGRIN